MSVLLTKEDFAACRYLCPRQEKSRGDILQPIAYGVCRGANGTFFSRQASRRASDSLETFLSAVGLIIPRLGLLGGR